MNIDQIPEALKTLHSVREGSGVVDVLIHLLLFGKPVEAEDNIPAYSTSFEVAMDTLERNLPANKNYGKTETGEGWKIGFYRTPYAFEGPRWWQIMVRDHAEDGVNPSHPSLPIGIIIALLMTIQKAAQPS